MPISRDDVLKVLDQIIDPASGRSVVHQGLITGLVVRDGHVGFAVEVDPKRGRDAEPLREECEKTVSKMAGVLSVTAVLTAHEDKAVHRTAAPAPAARRTAHAHAHGSGPLALDGLRAISAVASAKGGV